MDITVEEAQLAIALWGEERQTDMLIEEMGEWLTAWNHFKRNRISEDEYVSELADVHIVVQQLMVMHKDSFDKVYQKKLEKFRRKLYKHIPVENDVCDVGC